MKKQAISALLAASVLAGLLAGCGGSNSSSGGSGSQGGGSSDERITVRILKAKASNEVALDQMEIFKIMGDKFNIDFEFDNPPEDSFEERLNLAMMDTEIPDVIMGMETTDVMKYATFIICPCWTRRSPATCPTSCAPTGWRSWAWSAP